jgi:pimeloyl-ACP methyl ester carboxylesterase
MRYRASSSPLPCSRVICDGAARGTFLLALIVFCGIARSAPTTQPTTHASVDWANTWLLHLPGIGGELGVDHDLKHGLRDGGWEGPITIYDWTEHDPGLDALLAHQRNEREASKVADMIEQKLRENPNLKITLTAHSGGTGIAVWALEKLPPGMKVQTLMLLSSALSPGYDLSKALQHVRNDAFSFYSKNDTLVLGAGTKMFGTIDGKKTFAAGLLGFTEPPDANAAVYRKLQQRPWVVDWMAFENAGSHIGCMSPEFAEHVLAPALIADQSDSGSRR